ncbi:DUF5666 domain-containing protein [Vibrio alfacsensis]|uniref:DUF5666 domain-containing protein n=1 Tax=Vibrio alfacsensis TaxID=1074311 RepID=UPI00406929D6
MRKITLPLIMLFGVCASASSFADSHAVDSQAADSHERLLKFGCTGLVNSYDASTRSFVLSCQAEHVPDFQTKTVMIDDNTQITGIQESNLAGATVEVEGVVVHGKNLAKEIELGGD